MLIENARRRSSSGRYRTQGRWQTSHGPGTHSVSAIRTRRCSAKTRSAKKSSLWEDVMKIHTRELMLAALQLPLAGFIAGVANAQSPQQPLQLERLEALVRAQAAQIEKLGAEMKTVKKTQSETSQLAQPASPPAEKKVKSKTSQQVQTASPPAPARPLGPPVAYPVAYLVSPPGAKTPGAVGSPQYPNYVVAGTKPLSWMLPGSDISLQIGGYAKLDAIGITGGNRSVGANDQFNVFQIQTRGAPTGNAPGDPSSNIHARQSRIYLEASKTDTPLGPARAYFEADFFGPIDLGTPTVSNSHTFRLRHAFAEVGPLLAGQTWSTYIDPSTYAEILDFTGPGGESFARQGQVRYTHNFGGGFSGAIAVENPQSRIRIGEGPVSGTGAVPALTGLQDIGVGPLARDSTPDFIARIKYESPQFNLQLSGVGTRSTAPPATAATPFVPGNGNFGFGTQLSGQIALPLFNDKDNFRFMTGYLDGASRYMLDVANTAPSVAYNATLTQFDSIKAYGGFGALQHWWSDKLRTNLVFSYVNINNPIYSGPKVIAGTRYGIVNLLYSPWPDVDIGAEFQYGQRIDADGTKGFQTRVQSSVIYRF
jgi:Porin subfamily